MYTADEMRPLVKLKTMTASSAVREFVRRAANVRSSHEQPFDVLRKVRLDPFLYDFGCRIPVGFMLINEGLHTYWDPSQRRHRFTREPSNWVSQPPFS